MMEWVTPTYNTFTNGSIVFSNGSELSQDNSNFFWDNTSKRLGLGRTPTSARLEIEAPVNNYQAIKITPTTLANTYMVFERSTADPLNGLIIGNGISSANTPYTNASVIGTMGAKNETITLLSGYNASTSSTGDINLRGKTVFIGSAFTNDTSDSNLIQVANTYYSTGTVSLSGTTVTGTGTIFTPDMVGMTISITGLSWTTRTIIAYNSPTSLTVDVAGTVSGSLSYKIYNAGLQVTSNNSISINRKDASSFLHLGAGRTTIGNSPLKFTAGPTLTTPESGAVEFDGNHFYGTVGTARHQLDQQTYMHKYAASGNGVTTTIVIPH
ncbi:MAG: hypothetical protein EOP46_04070 [Sphingobacteriaceae bacterium]|nr:MAG: hypothetical protein EOP46_04070 [Sphingobacteriaceae bacterium]